MSTQDPLAALREPATIRARCAAITRAVEEGRSGHFTVDRSALPALAQRVAKLTRERFPDLKIPYHSRWRHFEAGGVDRKAELDARLAGRSAAEVARARVDLTVISVLLDAGAGPAWRYTERPDGPIDPLALPVHRQRGDDLLAMLNQAAGTATPAPAGAPPEQTLTATSDASQGEAPPEGTSQDEVAMPMAVVAAAAPQASAPDAPTASVYTRSEGLGVASFRAFMAGVFSADPADPCRVDALALKRMDAAALRAVFQASPSNPLVGLDGRAALLARLGEVLEALAAARGGLARPGRLFDELTEGGQHSRISARDLLTRLVTDYAPIWTSGNRVLGLPAGDVWPHLWAGADTATSADRAPDRRTSGWVPFHKLSQWLTYSLLEPFEWAGVAVTGLEDLTGLPEYRNGGLLLDGGVIVPRDPRDLARTWTPAHEFVVEWRALTVSLLDDLAAQVREVLGVAAEALPLACILEGGTWAAGRQIARERREGGAPPLQIDSDGTVF